SEYSINIYATLVIKYYFSRIEFDLSLSLNSHSILIFFFLTGLFFLFYNKSSRFMLFYHRFSFLDGLFLFIFSCNFLKYFFSSLKFVYVYIYIKYIQEQIWSFINYMFSLV